MKSKTLYDVFPVASLAEQALDTLVREQVSKFFPEIEISTYSMNITDLNVDELPKEIEDRHKAITSAKTIGYTVTVTFRKGDKVMELHFQHDRPIHPLQMAIYRTVDYFVKEELYKIWDDRVTQATKSDRSELASMLVRTIKLENDARKAAQTDVG